MSLTDFTLNPLNERESYTDSLELQAIDSFGASTRPPELLDKEFWSWWLSHRPQLWTLSLRLMQGNRAEAEDALSVAALKAHANYPRLAHRLLKPREWLTTLLRNVCMDRYRERRFRGELLNSLDESHAQGLTLLPQGCLDPEERLCVRARMESLRTTLQKLPHGLRQPFLLRFQEGRSYSDIALLLGLTQANVRKRIQLARARLRGLMED